MSNIYNYKIKFFLFFQIDLCIEWAELHQVSTQLQWLVDHRFILLLFEHRPPKHADARKVFIYIINNLITILHIICNFF